mgnify:CR=1 FL=1
MLPRAVAGAAPDVSVGRSAGFDPTVLPPIFVDPEDPTTGDGAMMRMPGGRLQLSPGKVTVGAASIPQLQAVLVPPVSVVPAPPVIGDQADFTPSPSPLPAAVRQGVNLDDLGLGFLGGPPKARVIFYLPYGQHQCRYHAVCRRDNRVSLVIDNRYMGDLFSPAPTEEGQPVKLRVLSDGIKDVDEEYYVDVLGFNMTIGCLDIIDLLIAGPTDSIASTEMT